MMNYKLHNLGINEGRSSYREDKNTVGERIYHHEITTIILKKRVGLKLLFH